MNGIVFNYLNIKIVSITELVSVKDYFINKLVFKNNFINDYFIFIIDTGCVCTCFLYTENFEYLHDLAKSIIIKNVINKQNYI